MNLNDHVDLGFACLSVVATGTVSAVTTALVVRVRHRDVRRQAAEIRRWAAQAPGVRGADRPVLGPAPLTGLAFEPGTGTAHGSPSTSPSLAPAEGVPAGAAPAGPFPGDFFPLEADAPGVGRLFESELSAGHIFEAPPGPVSGPPAWPPFPAGDQPAEDQPAGRTPAGAEPGAERLPARWTPMTGTGANAGAGQGDAGMSNVVFLDGYRPTNGDPDPGRMADPGLRTEPGRPWDPGRDSGFGGSGPEGRGVDANGTTEPESEPEPAPDPEPVAAPDRPDRPPAYGPEFLPPPDTADTVIIPRITSEMIAAGVLHGEVVSPEQAADRPQRFIADPAVPVQREPHVRPAVPGKSGKPTKAKKAASGGRHRAARR